MNLKGNKGAEVIQALWIKKLAGRYKKDPFGKDRTSDLHFPKFLLRIKK